MPELSTPAQEVSDWQLLAEAGDGDEEAFRLLVERHQDRLIRLCERLLQDRVAALDAVQEVFLKTYRSAKNLKPRGQLYSWLYRVATNYCLNRLRRRGLIRFLPLGGIEPEDRPPVLEPVSGAPDPLETLAGKQRWQATRRDIEALPASQRAVLVLARFEGLAYREIAEILDISEGAVESRLFRAMRNLVKAQESRRSIVSQKEVDS